MKFIDYDYNLENAQYFCWDAADRIEHAIRHAIPKHGCEPQVASLRRQADALRHVRSAIISAMKELQSMP